MSETDEDYAFGLYPDGSGVLRNKFGLRDAAALQAVEYQVTANRERDAPVFPPTREGYQALHRHLFQEVFDWAGELRTVNFGKGGSRFATARYLDTTLDTLFADLASRDRLRGRTGERFADGIAHHVSELNVAHPFREGNGRAMRLHLSQLAGQAGHTLDITRMDGPAWIEASIRGFEGDERPLANLIAGAIKPARWMRPDDALAELAAAIEPGKLDIRAKTRAIAGMLRTMGAADLVREDVKGLHRDMDRLTAATNLARPLEELRGTDRLIPVRAGTSAPPADRAHAILAAAERLPAGMPLPGAAAIQDPTEPSAAQGTPPSAAVTIMAALRAPEPTGAAPWDAALTPMAARLAEYQARKDAETAATKAATNPPAAEPVPVAPARPKPDRDPGPSF